MYKYNWTFDSLHQRRWIISCFIDSSKSWFLVFPNQISIHSAVKVPTETSELTNLTNWLLRNPEVHYRPFRSSPLIPIFSKIYPVIRITIQLPQIYFNIVLALPKGLFPSGFPTKTLYAFPDSSIRATCSAHFSLDLRFLIMLGEGYNAFSSAYVTFSILL